MKIPMFQTNAHLKFPLNIPARDDAAVFKASLLEKTVVSNKCALESLAAFKQITLQFLREHLSGLCAAILCPRFSTLRLVPYDA